MQSNGAGEISLTLLLSDLIHSTLFPIFFVSFGSGSGIGVIDLTIEKSDNIIPADIGLLSLG
jgi:hypothetical protein